MTGLVRLIDNLLTVKAGPLLDVAAIKPAVTIQGPGAVIDAQLVDNDVRLLSNAALDRQLPGAQAAGARALGGQSATAPHSSVAELSMAARVIGAVLADLQNDAGPVRGAALAWPSAGSATPAAVAHVLAQTVAQSGMFYESHLVDLVQGTRTLTQLAQEPQARWSSPALAQTLAAAAAADASLRAGPATPLPTAAGMAASAASAASVAGTTASAALQNPAVLAADAGAAPAARPVDPPAASKTDAPAPSAAPLTGQGAASAPLDAYLKQAPQPWGDAATQATAAHSASAVGNEELSGRTAHALSAAASTTTAGAEVIHPQAVTLVHQQLDLLATSVFRWSGQAWPGVAMDWSIEAQPDDRSAGTPEEADAPRRWATTVSLDLPQLGAVQLRVSLLDSTVRAALVTNAASTRTRLSAEGSELASRLAAAGMTLEQFNVNAGEPA